MKQSPVLLPHHESTPNCSIYEEFMANNALGVAVEMDGRALNRCLRPNKQQGGKPVIMLSARNSAMIFDGDTCFVFLLRQERVTVATGYIIAQTLETIKP